MDGWSNDTLAIYHTNRLSLSRYRYLQDGAVWHVQPITLDIAPVRGHCNVTQYKIIFRLSMLWKFCHDFDIFATLSISLDVWRIFVCVFYINAYVNEYTVACNEWNSVACNTTTILFYVC